MGSCPAMMNPIGRLWQHCAMPGSCLVGSCGLCAQDIGLRSRLHRRSTIKDSDAIKKRPSRASFKRKDQTSET